MERAAFYAAWREKKLRGVFMTAVGNSGNAASRVEEFIQSKGAYAYGGYPDIDDLFQQQARERDPKKREAMLFKIQQLTIDRAMFAPGHGPARADGRRPARRQAHDHRRVDEPVPVVRGHATQSAVKQGRGGARLTRPAPAGSVHRHICSSFT